MVAILKDNFSTFAMLLSLLIITGAVVVLILSGRCTGNDVAVASLCTAVGSVAGGIAGYSMHKTADSSVQSSGVQITKSETGA